jgi:hypothetical protein
LIAACAVLLSGFLALLSVHTVGIVSKGSRSAMFLLLILISMDRALQRRTQRQPTPRGRRPPLYPRGGGGGLVYGRRKNECGPTGLWMDSPERATGVGVGPMRWIVHVWEGVIRLEGWGEGI